MCVRGGALNNEGKGRAMMEKPSHQFKGRQVTAFFIATFALT